MESRSTLLNISLVKKFLRIAFTKFILKNFYRMKRWWREELQRLATTCMNNQTQFWKVLLNEINEKNCSSGVGTCNSFRSKFFARYTSICFKSFLIIAYAFANSFKWSDKMFDLRDKELKYRKKLLLNHYRKSLRISMRFQEMCGLT